MRPARILVYDSMASTMPIILTYHWTISTDDSRGKMYYNVSNPGKLHLEMNEFIEMCYAPKSPMNKRLKRTPVQLLEEKEK